MVKTLKVYGLNHDFLDVADKQFCGDMYFATQEAEETLTLNKDELVKSLTENISRMRAKGDTYDEELDDIGFYLLCEHTTEFDTDDEDFATMEDIESNLAHGNCKEMKVLAIYVESNKKHCDECNFEELFRKEYGEDIEIHYPND